MEVKKLPLKESFKSLHFFCLLLDCDPVVPYKFGQMSSSVLKTFMKNIVFTSYRGLSHSSSDEEMSDMKVKSQFNFCKFLLIFPFYQ